MNTTQQIEAELKKYYMHLMKKTGRYSENVSTTISNTTLTIA